MSYVNEQILKPVLSLDFKNYQEAELVRTPTFKRVTKSNSGAIWRTCLIKNNSPDQRVFYRADKNNDFLLLLPAAEIPIPGWGSYIEIRSLDGIENMDIEVFFDFVQYDEALLT